MSDAPERIWAGRWPHGGRAWRDAPAVHIKTEYIRADLVAAMEDENQRLRASLQECMEIVESVSDKRAYRALKTRARAILNSTEGSHG